MSIPMAVRSRSASPDFSNTAPMNTKKGMARKVKLASDPANQLLNRPLRTAGSSTPVANPSAKNTNAVPAKEKATG